MTYVQLRISYSDEKKRNRIHLKVKPILGNCITPKIIIENFKGLRESYFRNNLIVGKVWTGNDLIFCTENDQHVKLQNE